MKNLLLNSILVLLAGCTFANYSNLYVLGERPLTQNEIKPFLQNYNVALYKTQVNVYGNYISGILFFKKVSPDTTRVTFLSEFGLKFFDIEFFGKDYKKYYFIDYLNQDVIIKLLAKDLQLILLNYLPEGKIRILRDEANIYKIYKYQFQDIFNYIFKEKKTGNIIKIENSSDVFKYIVIDFSDYDKGLAKSIDIEHQNFSLSIKLSLIECR